MPFLLSVFAHCLFLSYSNSDGKGIKLHSIFFFLSNPPNPGYRVTQTQRFSLHKLYASLVRMCNTECLSSLSRARLLQSHNQSGSEGRIQPELYSSIHYMDNSCQQRRE